MPKMLQPKNVPPSEQIDTVELLDSSSEDEYQDEVIASQPEPSAHCDPPGHPELDRLIEWLVSATCEAEIVDDSLSTPPPSHGTARDSAGKRITENCPPQASTTTETSPEQPRTTNNTASQDGRTDSPPGPGDSVVPLVLATPQRGDRLLNSTLNTIPLPPSNSARSIEIPTGHTVDRQSPTLLSATAGAAHPSMGLSPDEGRIPGPKHVVRLKVAHRPELPPFPHNLPTNRTGVTETTTGPVTTTDPPHSTTQHDERVLSNNHTGPVIQTVIPDPLSCQPQQAQATTSQLTLKQSTHPSINIKHQLTHSLNNLIDRLQSVHNKWTLSVKSVTREYSDSRWSSTVNYAPSQHELELLNYINKSYKKEKGEIAESIREQLTQMSTPTILNFIQNKFQFTQNNTTPPLQPPGTDKPKGKNRKSKKNRPTKFEHHDQQKCISPDCFTCATNNVVNLTGKPLSKDEIMVLNRGLSFVPTPLDPDPGEAMMDLGKFIHNVKMRHAKIKTDNRTITQTDWPSTRLLPKPFEDAFHALRSEISDQEQYQDNKPKWKQNLTRKERAALRNLSSNKEIVLNRADKANCVVVKNREDYVREGLEHLSDTNTYTKLDRDHTPEVTKHINTTLEQYRRGGLLSLQMVNKCRPTANPRTARLYFLTKTHKSPMSIRPIVSCINCATENLSRFLDSYLQPMMKQLPAFIKDTTHFINAIEDIDIQPTDLLVTVDVKSLYTNIPNQSGIDACYSAWQRQQMKDPQHPPAETLRHLLEMVLKLNTLEFDQEFYLQTSGTAMGQKLAPAYANVFMGQLEESILNSSIYKPKYYCRFIDDIFLIFPYPESDLAEFMQHMNSANKAIQFTHEYSQSEVTFLDVTVYKNGTNRLQVKTFIKPTNKQLYVRYDSHHPPGTTKGIAIGEAMRFLRTNSEKRNFHKMLFLHKRNLRRRGYPAKIINTMMKRVKFSMRREKLKQSDKGKTRTPPTFAARYGPRAVKTFKRIRKHWTSMEELSAKNGNKHMNNFLKDNRPHLSYRSNPNLANRLVRA